MARPAPNFFAHPIICLVVCVSTIAACMAPAKAFALQTRQSGLIRSVVLDAPRDQAILIDALSGLRGRLLTPELRSSTHHRLATLVDTLGWTNAQITVPAQLPATGRWLLQVTGSPPQAASPPQRTSRQAFSAQSPAGIANNSRTLQQWMADPMARVLIVRAQHQLFAKFGSVAERFPVAVGRRSNPTPLGRYTVQNIAYKPTWYPTKRMRISAQQSGRELPKRVPPGPANPLGDWFVALGHSIGIHGNNSPWSIGRSVSSGCVRMRNADIERLARSLLAGDGVWVVDALAPADAPSPREHLANSQDVPRPQAAVSPTGVALSIGPGAP